MDSCLKILFREMKSKMVLSVLLNKEASFPINRNFAISPTPIVHVLIV